MSFAKASDLMVLANAAAAFSKGVSLEWITEKFGVSHRTAQRMTHALEETFQNVEVYTDASRRRFWRITARQTVQLQGDLVTLAALETAISAALESEDLKAADVLSDLRLSLLAQKPRGAARGPQVLAKPAQAMTLGPHVPVAPELWALFEEAVSERLALALQDAERRRKIFPYLLVRGARAGVVAVVEGEDGLQLLPLGPQSHAVRLEERFERAPDLDPERFIAPLFAVTVDPTEPPVAVEILVQPEAAVRVQDYVFHPSQTLSAQADGGVTLRFTASGLEAIAAALMPWGEHIEVVAPKALRKLLKKGRLAHLS